MEGKAGGWRARLEVEGLGWRVEAKAGGWWARLEGGGKGRRVEVGGQGWRVSYARKFLSSHLPADVVCSGVAGSPLSLSVPLRSHTTLHRLGHNLCLLAIAE